MSKTILLGLKRVSYILEDVSIVLNGGANKMAIYKQEVKDQCIKAAKEGMHLKEIQAKFGPNPKATMRYLVKAGVDYKAILAKLKTDGKTPQTLVQKSRAKVAATQEARKNIKAGKPGKEPVVTKIEE